MTQTHTSQHANLALLLKILGYIFSKTTNFDVFIRTMAREHCKMKKIYAKHTRIS